jgi:hypothetical protein
MDKLPDDWTDEILKILMAESVSKQEREEWAQTLYRIYIRDRDMEK